MSLYHHLRVVSSGTIVVLYHLHYFGSYYHRVMSSYHTPLVSSGTVSYSSLDRFFRSILLFRYLSLFSSSFLSFFHQIDAFDHYSFVLLLLYLISLIDAFDHYSFILLLLYLISLIDSVDHYSFSSSWFHWSILSIIIHCFILLWSDRCFRSLSFFYSSSIGSILSIIIHYFIPLSSSDRCIQSIIISSYSSADRYSRSLLIIYSFFI